VYNNAHLRGRNVPKIETNARKIISRLEREGWVNIGGGGHERFVKKERQGIMIAVPRHRELTPGTARSIAKAAGWI
jgi:predicted RNA binding protein YcfA (HicA-like mRNA interferase family)